MANKINEPTVKNIASNIKINNLSKDNYTYKNFGIIEDIADFVGIEEPRIEQGYNLLKENNIQYKKEDIKSVKKNDNQLIVEMKNGEKIIFDIEDGGFLSEKYVLSKVVLSDGTIINCKLSEEEQRQIAREAGLTGKDSNTINIKGYATVDVGGHEVKVYWTGDATEFSDYKAKLELVKKGLNKYPKNVLDEVFGSIDFKGIFVSTSDTLNYGEEVQGQTNFTKYIYLNAKEKGSYAIDTIEHEFAHLIDYVWYKKLTGEFKYPENGSSHVTINQNIDGGKFNSLFEKYRELLTKIDNGGYRKGTESPSEFFAQAVSIYIEHGPELKKQFPDLYNYIDNFLKNF